MYRRINKFHEALNSFSNVIKYLKDDKTVYV